jgi:hypothetical protein
MKKIVITMLAVAFCGIIYAGDSIVKSGNFDSFDGWRKGWPKIQGTLELEKVAEFVKSQPTSLKVTNNADDQYTFYRQQVTVKPNTEYVFSCWMKGVDIKTTKKGGAQYWILQKGGKTLRDGSFIGAWKAAVGTFEWSKVMISFNSNDNTALTIMVGLTANSTGTVWFDDVELYEKSK